MTAKIIQRITCTTALITLALIFKVEAAITTTECVGTSTTSTPPSSCSCISDGLSNCHTCLNIFDDGVAQTLTCKRCVGSTYLHDGECHADCSAFPWTFASGSDSFGRACEPIQPLVTVIDCGEGDESRCRSGIQYSQDVGGCDATIEFDVTPSTLASIATAGSNARICASFTDCSAHNSVQVTMPTLTSDRECGVPEDCYTGEYEEAPATPTSNKVCQGLSKCDRGVTFETASPTLTSNRVCELGKVCEPGIAFEVVPMTLTTDRECKSATVCSTSWVDADPEVLHPGILAEGQQAPETAQEYVFAEPTATTDRECVPLSQCKFCLPTDSDSECEYQSTRPNTTSDAECSTIRVCRLPFETVLKDASFWTNGVCQVPVFDNIAEFSVVVKAGSQVVSLPLSDLVKVQQTVQQGVAAHLNLDTDLFSLFVQLRDGDVAHVSLNLPTYDHVLSLRDYMPSFGMPFENKGFLVYVEDTFDPPETMSPTSSPTASPTFSSPTLSPSVSPTITPSAFPTTSTPTPSPTMNPSQTPTAMPTTPTPTSFPTTTPTQTPSANPTSAPTETPSFTPSVMPTAMPTPQIAPSSSPSTTPTQYPTSSPSNTPTGNPTSRPTSFPTPAPTLSPTSNPTKSPTPQPTAQPTQTPTLSPTDSPSESPTVQPTAMPTSLPTPRPTSSPTSNPTLFPTFSPTSPSAASIFENSTTATFGVGFAAAIVLLLMIVVIVQLSKMAGRKNAAKITTIENPALDEVFVDPIFKLRVENEEDNVVVGHINDSETDDAHVRPANTSTTKPITLDMVGTRVSVLGFGNGTLRFYGRHAYQPGFRCGVELDDMIGHNNGSVEGYYYFSCKDKYGLLVDPRKVGAGGQRRESFVDVCYGGQGGEVGNVAEATTAPKDQQLMSLQDQKDMAIATYSSMWRKKPDEMYTHGRNNVALNRYLDILPYDGTRVELSDNHGQSYINANYVSFYSQESGLNTVCCQGPMDATVADFWAMVWEQNANIILMLTGLVEGNRNKCSRYWPNNEGAAVSFGEYTVMFESTESSVGSTTVHKFSVTRNGEVRTINHVQFDGWPDHGVPERPADFMQMMQIVQNLQSTNAYNGIDAPTVVHCSAGVGRTGVFLLVSVVLDKLKQKLVVDVSTVLMELRKQRMLLVQMPQQFEFVFEALIWALNHRSWTYY